MNTAFLLTGGNMGDRLKNIEQAYKKIEQDCGKISEASSIYQTAAWGFTDQPDFFNQAIKLVTNLTPDALMLSLLSIEKEMGRERAIKMGPRIIDIDILLMNDIVYNSQVVTIPHLHLQKRRFALMPLEEIASDLIHPVLKKSIHELLDECNDMLAVHKISINK